MKIRDDVKTYAKSTEPFEFNRSQQDDRAQTTYGAYSMSNITREEFNAKIEAIEARMDARVDATSAKIDAFLSAQVERDKTCLERDKRYELIADRVTRAAEGAQAAAAQAAKLNAHYWAGICVQLLAVSAILVGSYCANQANIMVAVQTTLAAVQAGKDGPIPATAPSVSFEAPVP